VLRRQTLKRAPNRMGRLSPNRAGRPARPCVIDDHSRNCLPRSCSPCRAAERSPPEQPCARPALSSLHQLTMPSLDEQDGDRKRSMALLPFWGTPPSRCSPKDACTGDDPSFRVSSLPSAQLSAWAAQLLRRMHSRRTCPHNRRPARNEFSSDFRRTRFLAYRRPATS
jgi:hypothetical protein